MSHLRIHEPKRPFENAYPVEQALIALLRAAGWPVGESGHGGCIWIENGVAYVRHETPSEIYVFQTVGPSFSIVSYFNLMTMKPHGLNGLPLGVAPALFRQYVQTYRLDKK